MCYIVLRQMLQLARKNARFGHVLGLLVKTLVWRCSGLSEWLAKTSFSELLDLILYADLMSKSNILVEVDGFGTAYQTGLKIKV